jgi:hypothetical protein
MDEFITIVEKNNGFEITVDVHRVGKDILVVVRGGAAHLGAIGMAESRPSHADPERVSATSSVFTFLGHKEDIVAKFMAQDLARALACKTVVVAGIHWDEISDQEINMIIELCHRLVDGVIEKVRQA